MGHVNILYYKTRVLDIGQQIYCIIKLNIVDIDQNIHSIIKLYILDGL